MAHRQGLLRLILALLLAAAFSAAQSPGPNFSFSVTPRPSQHDFHVSLRCSGLNTELADFEMAAWMPGYYRIMDYARQVAHFQVRDGQGHILGWEKTTPHTWRVVAAHDAVVVVSYDVAATRPFAADNSIDGDRAFIAPPGLFLYLAGQLARPATVAFHLPAAWHRIATGLAPLAGHPDTFSAPNFNVLLDSPLLLGNQETLSFRVDGRLHTLALEYVPASVSRAKMTADLRRIVQAATRIMGAIPYQRYTFLLMGHGDGGIEHLNSAAIEFNGQSLATPHGYQTWLSYVAHEYFHCFNVKRIRPLALGPFDYEAQNITDMLWVSEGLTVYYEDLILVRAGLITPAQYLATLQGELTQFENEPGRPYQSATESSLGTWSSVYGGRGNRNITISYYDNGAMLGAMLDLAIRHDSGGAKSLDDVMRALYHKYYLEEKRGFTDAEFRAMCEQMAGRPLPQVFSYASTTAPVDYAKYLRYAGVNVAVAAAPAPGASLGLDTDTRGGKLMVSGVVAGSPAQAAGLRAADQLLTLNGAPATAQALSALLAAAKAGDRITIGFTRGGAQRQASATLAARRRRTYTLRPMANPAAAQAALFRSWMGGGAAPGN